MTTRTFKQLGQAYGSTPAVITATINGAVVFSGEIPTINTPIPPMPDTGLTGSELYTWTNTVEFSGTQSISISVANATLLLTDSFADNCSNLTAEFAPFYSIQDDGVLISDPFTNVTIDGVAMLRGPDSSSLSGQWHWIIPAGSTWSATLNVQAGYVPPLPP